VAIISSVFGQLSEKVGEPYKSFPIVAFDFLEGGTIGWGTICMLRHKNADTTLGKEIKSYRKLLRGSPYDRSLWLT
jgi:hypothetical protein